MGFYKENAKQYFDSTMNEDFSTFIFKDLEMYLNGLRKDISILDIGCGSGRDTFYLSKKGFYNITAIDSCQPLLDLAIKETKLDNTFFNHDVCSFDLNKKFDFIYSIACLLHLDDVKFQHAMNNIKNHLSENGLFFFTVKKGSGNELDSMGRYFNYYSYKEMETKLKDLDLKIVYSSEKDDMTRPDTKWLYFLVSK